MFSLSSTFLGSVLKGVCRIMTRTGDPSEGYPIPKVPGVFVVISELTERFQRRSFLEAGYMILTSHPVRDTL